MQPRVPTVAGVAGRLWGRHAEKLPTILPPADDIAEGEQVTQVLPAVADGGEPRPAKREPRSQASTPRWWMLAVPVGLITAALTSYGAGHELYDDEYITDYVTRLSVPQLAHLIHGVDVVHLLYYVIITAWTHVFGHSVLALRAPSIIGMAVAAGAVTVLGRRLNGWWTGLAGGLLFAALPSVSNYGQWARSYGFVVAVACLDTLVLIHALDRRSTRRWLLYAALSLVLAYLHMAAMMVLLPHAVLVFAAWRKERGRQRRDWLYCLAGVGILTLPLLYGASHQTRQVWWVNSDLASVRAYPGMLFGSPTVAWVVCLLGLVGAIRLAQSRPVEAVTLAVWALVPPVLAYFTVPVLHMFYGAYQLFTLPAWVLLGGCALAPVRIAGRSQAAAQLAGIVAAAIVLGLAGLAPQRAIRQSPYPGMPDLRAAATAVEAGYEPGDGIVYAGQPWPVSEITFAYYLGSATPKDVFIAVSTQDKGTYYPGMCADSVACLADTPRIWLVIPNPKPGDEYQGLSEDEAAALRRLYESGRTEDFTNIRVVLLTRKPASTK